MTMTEVSCVLCVGECRGHSLGRPEEWEPEPGSLAAQARGTVTIETPDGLFDLATDRDRAVWNAALALASKVIEDSTSWGLSPTKLEAVESFQRFGAKAIRAQRTDSEERARHDAKAGGEGDDD